MRVIGGEFRSRRLKSVPGITVRPTPDRLRESLFSILAADLPGCRFLDLYAGSGAVGIEALSRGAAQVVFVESHPPALRVLRENLRALGIDSAVKVVTGNAAKAVPLLAGESDIVFLDPPYEAHQEYAAVMAVLGAAPPPLVILQHSSRWAPAAFYGGLARYRTLKQGDNSLTFYRPLPVAAASGEPASQA